MSWMEYHIAPLAATSWVDVSIPLIGGLFLLIQPKFLFKKSERSNPDPAKTAQLRFFGFVLLGVAGIYFVTTNLSS